MKIVVIGGTGLIGSKAVGILRQGGHEAVAASPNSGVNSITGEGLKEAMVSALVVIDLANSPSFEDRAVLEFFETSGRNLLAAETAAGVRHHVALLIVAIDRTDNRYFRAALGDPRQVVRDPDARYWGGQVERSPVPLGEARLGRVRLNEWFRRSSVLHGRLRRVRRLCQPVPRPREQAEY